MTYIFATLISLRIATVFLMLCDKQHCPEVHFYTLGATPNFPPQWASSFVLTIYQTVTCENRLAYFVSSNNTYKHSRGSGLLTNLVFFPFKNYAALAVVLSGLPGQVCGERERGDKPSQRREIMAAPLGRDTLPDHWSYGVCRDGRVFFIK